MTFRKMLFDRRSDGLIAAVCIATYFLWTAGPGLNAYFTLDDMMNLHAAWMKPAGQIVLNNIFYFDSVRSLGDLYYRITFALGGFHALPFRVLCYTLLLINLLVLYRFAKRMTGSFEVASLATAAGAYHARFRELYCNTGTVFDLLCFPFYFGALTYYIGVRNSGAALTRRQLSVFLALYVCALNAKEMAVTLPLVIAIYELLFHPPSSLRQLATLSWWRESASTFLLCVLVTAPYVYHILTGAQEFKGHPGYVPHLSAARLFSTLSMYFDEVCYKVGWFNTWRLLAVWSALGCLAWILRSRSMLFCIMLSLVALLPLAFIPPREMYAVYLPWAGWAVCAGILLARIYQALWWVLTRGFRSLTPGTSQGPARVWRIAILVLTLVLLARAHRVQRSWTIPCRISHQAELQTLASSLVGVPRPASHSHILLLNDPFGDYTADFFFRLFYQDRTLDVVRSQTAQSASIIVEFRDGNWLVR